MTPCCKKERTGRKQTHQISYNTAPLLFLSEKGKEQEIFFQTLLEKQEYTVLYTYPKDNTPGCTQEGKDFTTLASFFLKQHIQIIGVSKDSIRSHCSFQEKQDIRIGLISDPTHLFLDHIGARAEKTMMGKKYMGTERNTYFLDKMGNILYKRERVSAKDHARHVLDYVTTFISSQ